MPKSLLERFNSKVIKTDGCWLWTDSTRSNGYGVLRIGSSFALAHRLAYELFIGKIPDGLVIDHLCRNRICVNPNHLEAVTQRENILRGDTHAAKNAAKTSCKNGHNLSGTNLYITPDGRRQCRACRYKAGLRCVNRKRGYSFA